jgi:hypothetical protein
MRRALPAFLLAAFVAAAPAAAQEAVHFGPLDKGSPQGAVVQSMYGESIAKTPGISVETALADLEGKQTASIFVRFKGPGLCAADGETCTTVLLVHDGTEWREAFERTSRTLTLGPQAGGWRMIVADGGERWFWTPQGFRPDPARFGTALAFGPADEGQRSAAFRDMRLPQQAEVFVAEADFGKGRKGFFALAESGEICGQLGCPFAVYARDAGGSPRLAGRGLAHDVRLGTASPDGARGFFAIRGEGIETWQWDGAEAKVSETTFPSRVTPRP